MAMLAASPLLATGGRLCTNTCAALAPCMQLPQQREVYQHNLFSVRARGNSTRQVLYRLGQVRRGSVPLWASLYRQVTR